jgi:hypothetical protein
MINLVCNKGMSNSLENKLARIKGPHITKKASPKHKHNHIFKKRAKNHNKINSLTHSTLEVSPHSKNLVKTVWDGVQAQTLRNSLCNLKYLLKQNNPRRLTLTILDKLNLKFNLTPMELVGETQETLSLSNSKTFSNPHKVFNNPLVILKDLSKEKI